jgi:hypothetical protein
MPTIIKYEKSKITDIKNDEFLKLIEYWWIELSEKGEPVRELGFDASDEIVYAAQAGRDKGLWVDSNMYFESPDDFNPVEQMAFELKWKLFEKTANG